MLSQRTQTNNLFRNAVTMDSVPAQDVLQLLGQTEPEIVLLHAEVAQKLIHTVHSALQIVAHFQQLGFPLSVGPQQRVCPLDFLDDERWNPWLFEKAVHQPFVQSRQHHVVIGLTTSG